MGVERLWLSTYTSKCSAFQGGWKMDLWIETGGRKTGSDAVHGYRHNGCQLVRWKNSLNEDNFLQSWLLKIHQCSNPVLELIHANLEIKSETQGVTDRNWIICLGLRLDLFFGLVIAQIAPRITLIHTHCGHNSCWLQWENSWRHRGPVLMEGVAWGCFPIFCRVWGMGPAHKSVSATLCWSQPPEEERPNLVLSFVDKSTLKPFFTASYDIRQIRDTKTCLLTCSIAAAKL